MPHGRFVWHSVSVTQTSAGGRPPLPAGEARTEVLRLRIKPAGKARLESAARACGITVTEAHRLAVAEWTQRNQHGRVQ